MSYSLPAIERQSWLWVALSLVTLLVGFTLGQSTATRHWELSLAATDADLSPDDHFLAVTLETTGAPKNGHTQAVESVQVWDYRENRKINDTDLATYPKVAPTPNSVRFTADGNLLVVSEPTRLHVLDPSVLKSLRVIEPPLGDDFRIFHIETAPVGHIVIVGANRYMSGLLFAYDLDSGRLLFKSESGWSVSSIAWNQDATQFAAATPFLCTRTHDTVQIFGTKPWLHLRTLSARNPTSVAFSPERLFLVESGSCKGSIFDRHLGLESFDTRQWHRKKTIFLRDRDIHDSVSFANGRLVTDSGKLETRHDWLDATTWGDTVDVQFTVWTGETPSIEFTSPSWPVPSRRPPAMSLLRLSRTGKMVISIHQQHPEVFEIP
jgi:hypothetical protein